MSAEDSTDEVTDPPKVEEKLGGHGGLSTDSDVVHRFRVTRLQSFCIKPLKPDFQTRFI